MKTFMYQMKRLTVSVLISVFEQLSFPDPVICCSKKWQAIPKSDEGEAEEKSKSSTELGDQGGKRVDQLLRPDGGLLRYGPQRECKISSFGAGHWFLCSNKLVHPVLARFLASRQLGDILQI